MPRGYPTATETAGFGKIGAANTGTGNGEYASAQHANAQKKQELLNRISSADQDGWTEQQKKMLGLIAAVGTAFTETGGSWGQVVQVLHKACDIVDIVPEAMALGDGDSTLRAASAFFVPFPGEQQQE